MGQSPRETSESTPADEISYEEWKSIAQDVIKILRSTPWDEVEIVRANAIGTAIYVLFKVTRADHGPGKVEGLRYDVSTDNFEECYPGSADQLALDLVLIEMREPSYYHPSRQGEISWRLIPNMPPGPKTVGQFDKEFSG